MAGKSSSMQNVDAIAEELLRRAALMGAFDPLNMLPPGLDMETQIQVLRLFGRRCEEAPANGFPFWRLKDDERRRMLAGLTDIRKVRRLAALAAPAEDDTFGRELQAALGVKHHPASSDPADQDAAYAARNFAVASPYAARRKLADPKPVRRKIDKREENERLKVVLPGALRGRVAERLAIEGFMRGEAIPEPFRLEPGPPPNDLPALLITGVGGVGKSALIAAILAEARGATVPLPVAIIDFDRPNLFGGDRVEIVREITRQLGRHFPALEARMSEARRKLGAQASAEASENLRLDRVALIALSESLRSAGRKRTRPPPTLRGATIILDTFEEIVVRGASAVTDILDWFEDLRGEGGLHDLRLIVSGRSPPDLPADEFAKRFAGHIALKGLDPEAGAALLRDGGTAAGLFDGQRGLDAAKAFHGHPLALKFLLRYAASHDSQDVDSIIGEGLESKNFSPEFAQVFLYTRILGRIRDPDVAKLAHPGLVLRRVTWELIRDVLAEHCGFGAISEAIARDLFNRLAATAWIVDRAARPDVVVHRRDLRRLMIPAIMNPMETDANALDLRAKAYAIHRSAAAWYDARRDTTSAPEEQAIEAFYHRACSDPSADLDLTKALSCAPALGEDLVDLPPRARAVAKAAMGRLLAITEVEFSILPADLQMKVRAAREDEALKRGDTAQVERQVLGSADTALTGDASISTAAHGSANESPATFAEAAERFGREINALWAEADFDGVAMAGDRAYGRIWSEGSNEDFIATTEDPVFTAVWKSLLARYVGGQWPVALTGKGAAEHMLRIYRPRLVTDGVVPLMTMHAAAIALAWRASNVGTFSFDPDRRSAWESLPDQLVRARIRTSFDLRTAQLGAGLARCLGQGVRLPEAPGQCLRLLAPPLAYRVLGGAAALGADHLPIEKQLFFSDADTGDVLVSRSFRHLADILTEGKSGQQRLSAIETLTNRLARSTLRFHNAPSSQPDEVSFFFECIQGRMPELHNPIICVLRPLAADLAFARRLADVGYGAPIWPSDFRELAQSNISHRTSDRFLASLIDFADQCGLLPRLMEIATQIETSDVRTMRVLTLVARVEDVFHNPGSIARSDPPADKGLSP